MRDFTRCRLAVNVLAREEVGETVLKSIPADADSFEVVYPVRVVAMLQDLESTEV